MLRTDFHTEASADCEKQLGRNSELHLPLNGVHGVFLRLLHTLRFGIYGRVRWPPGDLTGGLAELVLHRIPSVFQLFDASLY